MRLREPLVNSRPEAGDPGAPLRDEADRDPYRHAEREVAETNGEEIHG